MSSWTVVVRRDDAPFRIEEIEAWAFEVQAQVAMSDILGSRDLKDTFQIQFEVVCLLAAECFLFGGAFDRSPRECLSHHFKVDHRVALGERRRKFEKLVRSSEFLEADRRSEMSQLGRCVWQNDHLIRLYQSRIEATSPYQTRYFISLAQSGDLSALARIERKWLEGLSADSSVEKDDPREASPFARLVEAMEDGVIPEEWDWE